MTLFAWPTAAVMRLAISVGSTCVAKAGLSASQRSTQGIGGARRVRRYSVAMQSISTSELPGIPPAAAIVVRTGGSGPKRPRKASFIAS